MTSICSFAPLVDTKSRLLILGSMPGVQSLDARQYYAHPQNQFWKIMGELFGAGLDIPYDKRLPKLAAAKIAVWDVLASCERVGSLDSDITNEEVNDFQTFFEDYPKIKHVFFNGKKAEVIFRQHVLKHIRVHHLELAVLPSTSPAHAGMNFDSKLAAWRAITQI